MLTHGIKPIQFTLKWHLSACTNTSKHTYAHTCGIFYTEDLLHSHMYTSAHTHTHSIAMVTTHILTILHAIPRCLRFVRWILPEQTTALINKVLKLLCQYFFILHAVCTVLLDQLTFDFMVSSVFIWTAFIYFDFFCVNLIVITIKPQHVGLYCVWPIGM